MWSAIPRILAIAAFAAGTWAPLNGAAPPGSKMVGKPGFPVLLITLDTTRADRLGCYGGAGARGSLTPALDRLAARSTLFSRCEAPAPLTMPSHATILSGWNPARHGARKNLARDLDPIIPFLAPSFSAAGYETAAFVSSWVLLGRGLRLDRGFGLYDDAFYDSRRTRPATERRAAATLAPALAWIRARGNRPWFCWIHLYDAHEPYDPPEPYATAFRRNPYDGEIAYMDACLGRLLLGPMEKSGILDRALVVVCADHGEALGEHGEKTHGFLLYEATTRVPLLVKLPGQRERRVVRAPVGLVDVAPTIRDLARLPTASSDGSSLAPLLAPSGEEGTLLAAKGRKPIVMEALEGFYIFGWAPVYGMVEGPWKYILAPKSELYHLDGDPKEAVDEASKNAAVAQRLRAALETMGVLAAAPSRATGPATPEEMQALASLGYLSGAGGPPLMNGRDPKNMIRLVEPHEQAREAMLKGEYPKAAAAYEALLREDEKDPLFLLYLGMCYRHMGLPKKAEAYWKRAIGAAPGACFAYEEWGDMLLDLGRPRDAGSLASLGLERCGNASPRLLYLRAEGTLASGGPETKAIGDLDAATRLEPSFGAPYILRAVIYYRRGNANQALEEERTAAKAVHRERMNAFRKEPRLAALGAGHPGPGQ